MVLQYLKIFFLKDFSKSMLLHFYFPICYFILLVGIAILNTFFEHIVSYLANYIVVLFFLNVLLNFRCPASLELWN
jgi:hypothetical protein